MPIKLENVSGNGSIQPESIFGYSYSEEVSSLQPSSLSGATSQVTVSAMSVNSELTDSHADSKLLINNEMLLTDSRYGSVGFMVKGLSKSNEAVLITGDTVESRLNVERYAGPHGGSGSNLLTAINYYCSLVDVVPVISSEFASEMASVPVNFIAWKGILWEKLKELCAGFSASTTNNVGIEMLILDNELVFRKARQVVIDIERNLISDSVSIESFESAKSVKVFNYNTEYGEDKVFYELSNFEKNTWVFGYKMNGFILHR
jgi:hypothetical protein